MLRVSLLALAGVMSLAPQVTSAEVVLSRYRGVMLGDSVQSVVDRLKLAASDVTVVHEHPTIVQALTLRPPSFVSGTSAGADPAAEIDFTFHLGRLARIVVSYDRERTQGLTDADLHEVMDSVYGTPILLVTPTRSTVTLPAERQTIGRWEDGETLVLLWREQYPSRVGLTITSIAVDAALQEAIAAGAQLHAAGAPARDLARRDAEAAVLQDRDEKIRRDNKARFRP
jgi:hypothetical protein